MSIDRERHEDVHTDVDLEGNSVRFRRVVETVVEVDDLFRDVDGVERLELWSDDAGWSGIELRDGEFWRVNYSSRDDEYISEKQVGREAVIERVRDHINDPDAGGRGTFRRGATPP